jgi:hypothetical protein
MQRLKRGQLLGLPLSGLPAALLGRARQSLGGKF